MIRYANSKTIDTLLHRPVYNASTVSCFHPNYEHTTINHPMVQKRLGLNLPVAGYKLHERLKYNCFMPRRFQQQVTASDVQETHPEQFETSTVSPWSHGKRPFANVSL